LNVGDFFAEILSQVVSRPQLRLVRQYPGNPVMLIPPVNPGHSSLVAGIAHQQVPMRHATLLKFHTPHPDGICIVQLHHQGIVEALKGIVSRFPANLSPAREARVFRVSEGQSSIPLPAGHAVKPVPEGLTYSLPYVILI